MYLLTFYSDTYVLNPESLELLRDSKTIRGVLPSAVAFSCQIKTVFIGCNVMNFYAFMK